MCVFFFACAVFGFSASGRSDQRGWDGCTVRYVCYVYGLSSVRMSVHKLFYPALPACVASMLQKLSALVGEVHAGMDGWMDGWIDGWIDGWVALTNRPYRTVQYTYRSVLVPTVGYSVRSFFRRRAQRK